MTRYTRREALLAPALLAGCARKKGTGFPGYALVANAGGQHVAAVDLTSFAVARQIPVEATPSEVVAAPPHRAYVLSAPAGIVHEVDTRRLGVVRTARLGAPAAGLRLAPDGKALWVLCREARALVELPLESFRPARRIRLPGVAADFDIHREGALAVTFPADHGLAFGTLASGSLVSKIPAGSAPGPVRFRFDGRHALVGDRGARTLNVVSVEKGRVAVTLPLPLEPVNLCFNGDGGQLFLSGPGMDAVVIVYPYTTEIAETVLAGSSPGVLGATANPPYLFIANPSSDTVTVLDIDTRRLVAVVTVGGEPGHILFTPDGQYALVLNRRSGDMAVIRIPTLRTDAAGKSRRYRPAPLFNLIPVGPNPVSAAVV